MSDPTTVSARMAQRYDTATSWTAVNPTLLAGEIGVESDTKKWKVGTGSTAWNSLAYAIGGSYPIVNADIASNAEIAVSKLANGTARQLLQTDAAGTGVEWASNIDIPGTLDVTGAATFDAAVTATGLISANGRVSFPLGSAAAPSLYPGSDVNTGIYSPGADQVAVATNGTGRLFVDANGNVGLKVAAPSFVAGYTGLQADGGGNGSVIKLTNSTTGSTSTDGFDLILQQGGSDAYVWQRESAPLILGTAATERLRITSTGLVGIGTSAPTSTLHIQHAAQTAGYWEGKGLLIHEDATANQGIALYSRNDTEQYIASLVDNANSYLIIGTRKSSSVNGVDAVTIRGDGKVGIGTSSPVDKLHVDGRIAVTTDSSTPTTGEAFFYKSASGAVMSGFGATIETGGAGSRQARVSVDSSGNVGIGTTSPSKKLEIANGDVRLADGYTISWGDDTYRIFRNGSQLRFDTNGSQALAIDSSGRLLVGTSSALTAVDSAKSKLVVQGDTDGPGYPARFTLNNSVATMLANYKLGEIYFAGQAAGNIGASIAAYAESDWNTAGDTTDNPAYLVFSTTADGAASPTEAMRITNNGSVLINCTSIPTGGVDATAYDTSGDDSWVMSSAGTGGSYMIKFYNSNGLVGNIVTSGSATSYATSSDYRLKENITAVSDGITRLQQLKPSRFNFIADPGHTVDGFIAHEAQAVVPECVTGTKDEVDDDGNPVYQGIDQSKLVPLLTAALQEAIGEIESLKARLTAAGL
jgi:hypothetical protein